MNIYNDKGAIEPTVGEVLVCDQSLLLKLIEVRCTVYVTVCQLVYVTLLLF